MNRQGCLKGIFSKAQQEQIAHAVGQVGKHVRQQRDSIPPRALHLLYVPCKSVLVLLTKNWMCKQGQDRQEEDSTHEKKGKQMERVDQGKGIGLT